MTKSSISIAFVKGQFLVNLKIVVQISEWSQMTELNDLSKSGVTPNLPTLHRLAWTGSYSSTNCELLPKKLPIAAIY